MLALKTPSGYTGVFVEECVWRVEESFLGMSCNAALVSRSVWRGAHLEEAAALR